MKTRVKERRDILSKLNRGLTLHNYWTENEAKNKNKIRIKKTDMKMERKYWILRSETKINDRREILG